MSKQYKVVGACVANVPIDSPSGPTLAMFHQDAILPAGVSEERIKHLLSVGLIKQVGGSEAAAQPALSGEQGGDAKTVNARSSKAELVDYGVAQGGNRAELDALTLKELQGRYLKSGAQQ